MKESDLYPPLKYYLETQGYEVKGEVQNCDVVGVRGDEAPLVVELKLSFNLHVILQSVERLALTPHVYIGVPRKTKVVAKERKRINKLLRRLGLGLMLINPATKAGGDAKNKGKSGSVEIILDPKPYQPRESNVRKQRLLGEFSKRVGDPNKGGSQKRGGTMTAYRQRAIRVAEHLLVQGPEKASEVAMALELPEAKRILYQNHHGWFERVSRGIYELSPRGKTELPRWRQSEDD